jgi:toxin CptA
VSSPSEGFECQWRPSPWLLRGYWLVLILLGSALLLIDMPLWARCSVVLLALLHGVWVLPRHLRLSHPAAYRGLRCDAQGWHVFSRKQGWQAIELERDSLALPLMVLLRFHLVDQRRTRAVCIARDSLAADQHRRLRVRLKFSRHRWAAAK